QQPPAARQQGAQGMRFSAVFIAALAGVPEGLLVVRAFVVADGRAVSHHLVWNSSAQDDGVEASSESYGPIRLASPTKGLCSSVWLRGISTGTLRLTGTFSAMGTSSTTGTVLLTGTLIFKLISSAVPAGSTM